MSVMGNLLWDKPARTTTYDVRTPQEYQREQLALGESAGLSNQYATASQDPNYGIIKMPTVGEQNYQLDQTLQDTFNRVGSQGGQGSGYANAQAAKAAADYRLNFVKQMSDVQNQARNSLRSSMVTANASPFAPYSSFVTPPKPSVLSSLVSGAAGSVSSGGGAGGMLGGGGGAGGAGADAGAGAGAGAAMALSKGGLVTKPTQALIGENGPELVIPIKKVAQLLQGISTGGGMGVGMQ